MQQARSNSIARVEQQLAPNEPHAACNGRQSLTAFDAPDCGMNAREIIFKHAVPMLTLPLNGSSPTRWGVSDRPGRGSR